MNSFQNAIKSIKQEMSDLRQVLIAAIEALRWILLHGLNRKFAAIIGLFYIEASAKCCGDAAGAEKNGG